MITSFEALLTNQSTLYVFWAKLYENVHLNCTLYMALTPNVSQQSYLYYTLVSTDYNHM